MNKGKIIVAGIGPGSEADITPAVLAAIQSSDVIIGYKYYFRFIMAGPHRLFPRYQTTCRVPQPGTAHFRRR